MKDKRQHVKSVVANGVDREKKGNKRPPTDERYFFSFLVFSSQASFLEVGDNWNY